MAKRLKSTKDIFNNKCATTVALIKKIDLQVDADYKKLSHLRGSLLRATRKDTIARLSAEISVAAVEMGLEPTYITNKEKLLKKVTHYKRQVSFLRYSSYHQAVMSLCSHYEDFVGRVIEKYFEEHPDNLSNYKLSVDSKFIIDSVRRGDNLHHTLAKKIVGDLMWGSVRDWHKQLKKIKLDPQAISNEIEECFLIRNCIVHNDRKVSSQLNSKNPHKYHLRKGIVLTSADILMYKDALHSSMRNIVNEYNRVYPVQKGTWLNNDPYKQQE